jgi:hypothetical protein
LRRQGRGRCSAHHIFRTIGSLTVPPAKAVTMRLNCFESSKKDAITLTPALPMNRREKAVTCGRFWPPLPVPLLLGWRGRLRVARLIWQQRFRGSMREPWFGEISPVRERENRTQRWKKSPFSVCVRFSCNIERAYGYAPHRSSAPSSNCIVRAEAETPNRWRFAHIEQPYFSQ